MTPIERDRIMVRLLAAFPRPSMPDSTMAVWNEHLDKLHFPWAWNALAHLERNSTRQPAVADFYRAYETCRPESDSRALEQPEDDFDEAMCRDGLAQVRNTLALLRPKLQPEWLNPPKRKGYL